MKQLRMPVEKRNLFLIPDGRPCDCCYTVPLRGSTHYPPRDFWPRVHRCALHERRTSRLLVWEGLHSSGVLHGLPSRLQSWGP
eukprot:5612277-Amphidinium_carterae.1